MPTLARLLDEAAVVPTEGPVGYFVAGDWVTIATGTTPSRHQFLCAGQIVGGGYDWRWVGPVADPPPVWERLSGAGMRVAALDVPHMAVAKELNGVQLVEWGGHDRHASAASYPRDLLDDVNATYGVHPVGHVLHDRDHYSPCDYVHRAGAHRTHDEDAALLVDMLEGVRRKRSLSLDMLDRGDWDLFFTVFSETHCTGHQFWKDHDATHPWHDPALRARLGDPLRVVYRAVDAALGAHLERVSADTTVYVHLNHGMQAHYDGAFLVDPVLWRLEQYLEAGRASGWMSRVADVAGASMPSAVRRRAFGSAGALRRRYSSMIPLGYFDEDIPPRNRRRFWAQPNDTASGSIRLNLEGREAHGLVKADHMRAVAGWLSERLRELVNVETSRPAVADVLFTDDCYERVPGDVFGDLIVEWDRDAPIETVWSPATGVVRVPYEGNRSGDHHRDGLLLATGPGITPGRRTEALWNLDVAPTVAASLGHDLTDVDGLARADLVPAPKRPFTPAVSRPALAGTAPKPTRTRRRWPRGAAIPLDRWVESYVNGLTTAHHHTAVAAHGALAATSELRARIDALSTRVVDLDQIASITQVTAWLRQVEVPESLLVSVVTPTRNRRDRLARAIESVQRQTYERWEMLVVDDGSDDGTLEFVEKESAVDERIRGFRLDPRRGSSRARNHALDNAHGDVVVYLDDDNSFDADWLRATVWAFTEYPDVDVLYGARVVDDDDRHRRLPTRSLPFVQFLPWDRDEQLRASRVDQNVIAHRPSPVRFDEQLHDFMDWDHLLQLTDAVDPLPLPALAAYYYTDEPDRMTTRFRDEDVVYRYVRDKTIARRRGNA